MTIATSDSVDELPLTSAEEIPAVEMPVRREVPVERLWKRQLFLVLALVLAAAYGFFLFSFTAAAPGRFGIDENAYLVGGRNIAQHGTTGFKPSDDYQFVGAMWIRTPSGWYFPKYGFGTSQLYAVTILMHRPDWAFFISPACTALAVLGIFFLARPIVGSFYALLSMIVLAMGPTTLQLAILPDSHAPALCVVVWGMYCLLCWWQGGRWWIGAVAGLLLGFAVTVRYSEALLLFGLYSLDVVRTDDFIGPKLHFILKILGFLPVGPLGIAVISRVKWRSWRSYFSAAVPVIAWAIPVGALLCFNRLTIGHFTGYDSTNESNGFSLKYFLDKWDFAVNQIYLLGLFVFAPLGVAGLILMFRSNRRAALLLTLWFVPGTLLYTAYYWGGNAPSIAYLRFFLTLFPPLIIAAMYLLHSAQPIGKGSIAAPLAAAVLTASAAAIGLWGSIDELVRQHRGNMNMRYSAREITSHIPKDLPSRPMILADGGMFPIFVQYMQYMYDADWYPSDIFALRAGGGFGLAGVLERRKPGDDRPVVLQQERMDYIDSVRKGKTDADFVADARRLMNQALDLHRRIYVVIQPDQADYFGWRFMTPGLKMVEVNRWSEPCKVSYDDVGKHDSLAPSTMKDDNLFFPWHPRRWAMFEIRRAPATQPSIAVSSR